MQGSVFVVNKRPRAQQLGIIGCHGCGLVIAPAADDVEPIHCPRCESLLQHRHAGSMTHTSAFLLAALICYIPANLLPMMESNLFGQGDHTSTLLGGVSDLWSDQSYGMAILVFVASIVIPCAKFFALGLLLVSTRRHSAWARHIRSRIYRVMERLGYWSMLDVWVVGLATCLVQFQAIGIITPGAGVLFFGASVILTMLATGSFDPRLIWDDGEG
jgi:paraquat-inducible protein A